MGPSPQLGAIGRPRLFHGLDRHQRLALPEHRQYHRVPATLGVKQVIRLAEGVDLRGRGGAAFPFARKIKAVEDAANRSGQETVVLVNATEGEPAALKDKALLTHVPHLVLDGAMLAVRALGARELVIGVTDPGLPSVSLRAAIAEAGLEDFVRVVMLPERFVTGEGGALVRGANGLVPIPPGKKVRAANSGVDGLPTLLNNAETFAQLALLAEMGVERYRQAGTKDEPGTIMLSITTTERKPYVVEAASGAPLSAALQACGTSAGQGVLIGGYHGSWLTPEQASTVTLSRDGFKGTGATLGAGIIVPIPPDTCPLGELARIATYLGEQSAGQCGPCRLGLPSIAKLVNALASGTADASVISEIRRGSGMVKGRGACHHPDGSTRFLLSGLETFAEDVETHIAAGGCGRKVLKVLPLGEAEEAAEAADDSGLRLSVDWSRCAGHGLCGHLLPAMIELDPFGYPVIADSTVPTHLVHDSRQAAELCPALALTLSPAH